MAARPCFDALLRRWAEVTEDELLDIEGLRGYVGSEWLPSILKGREQKIKVIDINTRKGIHMFGYIVVYFVMTTYVIGWKSSAELLVAGVVITSIRGIMMSICMLATPERSEVWWLYSLLFGGQDRIRDGQYAKENLAVATFTSNAGTLVVYTIGFFFFEAYILKFCTALIFLPLSIGDAMGEIIGTPFGYHQFTVYGLGDINKKSVEGCAAVFLGSVVPLFFCTFTVDISDSLTTSTKVLLPILVSLLTVITESISFRSTDNFFIPVCNGILVVAWKELFGFSM